MLAAVADRIRRDAPEMVARLHRAGVGKVVMLTGDTRLVAESIGRAAGIDEIHASLLPEAIALAKRTVAAMRQNIVIALITVVVLLAGVFAGGVTMSLGMLVHEASVLVVIANAMRLLCNLGGSAALPKSERTRGRAGERVAA